MSRPAVERAVPYQREHDRSIASGMRKGHQPRGLSALIAWYITAWELETPKRLHVPGTWHDPEASSALGSPADDPEWRAYLYGSDRQEDADGYYVRPLHAALSRMTGSDPDSIHAFRARYALQLALTSFDWRAQGARWGMVDELAADYTEALLIRLWRVWTPQTPVRPSRDDAA